MLDNILNQEQKPLIILVDDEVSILNSTKSLLRRNYNIVTFTNPLEVEDFVRNNSVDLIVSDEMMPQLKGSELMQRINRINPNICKIILSGHSEKENIVSAINDGHIFAFLFKPTDNTQLMQVIEMGLENKKMKEEIIEKNRQLAEHNIHLEELVKQRTDQIVKMEKFYEVGKFSASIVHNLNNPLQSLIMATQLLEFDLEKILKEHPQSVKFLGMINGGLEMLEKMIKSITSNVRTSKSEEDQPLDLNKILQNCLEFLKIDADFKHNVEASLLLEPELKKVLGQEVHFTQIFSNLLKNAVDAMESIPEKSLSIQSRNGDDGKVVITIKDSGTGISEENLSRIFSTDFTTKPAGKGTGLGLPITKQMVEAYRGEIRVESQVGQGSSFIISIPGLE